MDVATKDIDLGTPDPKPLPDTEGAASDMTLPPDANDSEMPDATPPPPAPAQATLSDVHDTTMEQQSSQLKKKKEKRYLPPQPDARTFRTQQDFLDSLAPISIESVDPNSRKCPICWKPFGEAADPGFDNSEEPVRLRCNHVFGNKCLNHTYTLPGTSIIDVRPLTFFPESKGTALGRKLHVYAESNNVKSTSKSKAEIFSKMVEESYLPEKGTQVFGDHWWPVIRQLQSGTHDLGGVTLLDNAVILDRKPTKPKGPENTGKKLMKTPGGYDVYLPHAVVPPVPASFHALSYLSTGDSPASGVPADLQLPAEPSMFGLNWDQQQSSFFGSLSPTIASTPPLPIQVAPPFPSASFIPTSVDETSLTKSLQQPPSTWEEALAEKQTHLDILIAKKGEIKSGVKGKQSDLSNTAKQQLLAQQKALQQAIEREKLAEMHRQAQEAQARMKREVIRHLAVELARIYAEHQSKADIAGQNTAEDEVMQEQPRFLPTSITVHIKDLDSTSYKIRSLDQYLPMFYAHGDDDDSDGEVEDDDEHQSMLSKVTLVITRTICTSCCQISDRQVARLKPPTSLWWNNDRQVPDDCPICHKILFHKGGAPASRRTVMVNNSDEESEIEAV